MTMPPIVVNTRPNREQCSLFESPMTQHVIVGAGTIGSAVALRLVGDGHSVRLVSRGGSGPDHPAIERVAADATDAERLTAIAGGRAPSTTARTRRTTSG
jgi:Trk K+ transport system NAD-binding subunit